MKIKLDDYEKVTLELVIEWLSKLNIEEKKEMKMWFDISILCVKDIFVLKQILRKLEIQESVKDESKYIEYEYKNEKHWIKLGEEKFGYAKERLEEILRGIICILEKILPIGTIVKLKGNYYDEIKNVLNDIEDLKQIMEEKNVNLEEMELMILKRYVKVKDEKRYAEYAGCLYPVGMEDNKVMFIFSNDNINEIVYKGYESEKDKSYVCLVKKILVVEMGKISIEV